MVDKEKFEKHEKERKKNSGSIFSEIILGGQDGLVNTLGVILGIVAATNDPKVLLAGSVAAAFAESISMAAVAYTSKKSEYENYISEVNKEKQEIEEIPEIEKEEVRKIFKKWEVEDNDIETIVEIISKNKKAWIEIMVAHELEIGKISHEKPLKFSLVVGLSALIGSFIPILPITLIPIIPLKHAWLGSIIISALALTVIGYIKTKLTIGNPWKGGLKLMTIGILSAIAGYLVGYLIGGM